MRTGFLFSRNCFRATLPTLRPVVRRQQYISVFTNRNSFKDNPRKFSTRRPVLLAAALTPAAFVKLSEEDHKDGRSGEEQMLEASRKEIEKKVPDDVYGVKRFFRIVWVVLDQCVYEPIATTLRFLHLVAIFVPVIVTVPVIWIGKRQKERDNERSGTLWWYGFLVSSMERAGPAFIKVRRQPPDSKPASQTDVSIARTMGSVSVGYFPERNVQCYVRTPFQCSGSFAGDHEADDCESI